MINFRLFLEKEEHENYLSGIWRELGIHPEQLPTMFLSGPIHLENEGLWFNNAEWEIIKPISLTDKFVRIKFIKTQSPNMNMRVYRQDKKGQMTPYEGDPTNQVFIISAKKLATILSRGWQLGAGGNPPGI